MPTRARKSASTVARKAEAKALIEGVDVKYKGETYTIPPYEEWAIDALEAIDDERYTAVLRGILGDDQWTQFKATHKLGELIEFLNAVMDAVGQGNS